MPEQSIAIRRAVPADFAAVSMMRNLLTRQAHLERPQEFRPAPLDMPTEALFVQWLSAPDTRCLVAVGSDDVPIGYMRVWVAWIGDQDWMFSNHTAFVLELCVHPHHRRCGVGRALLEAAEAAATAEGAECVVLHVNTSNEDARNFYQRSGYLAADETRVKRLRTVVRIERP